MPSATGHRYNAAAACRSAMGLVLVAADVLGPVQGAVDCTSLLRSGPGRAVPIPGQVTDSRAGRLCGERACVGWRKAAPLRSGSRHGILIGRGEMALQSEMAEFIYRTVLAQYAAPVRIVKESHEAQRRLPAEAQPDSRYQKGG
jgi:hypothetical protein